MTSSEEHFGHWTGSGIHRGEMHPKRPRRPRVERWRAKATGSELIRAQAIDDEIEALLRERKQLVASIWRRS